LDVHGIDLLDTVPAEIGQDKSTQDYYTAFVNGDDLQVYVSPVQFSPATGEASLYFSSPVVDRTNGKLLGILRARYSADVLQELLGELSADHPAR
jgi:hypothetical protein